MNTDKNIYTFTILGKFFEQFSSISFNPNKELNALNNTFADSFITQIKTAALYNPWFTEEFVRYSLDSLSSTLKEFKLKKWVLNYPDLEKTRPKEKKIGLVMAGNIPLVGFHDMLCILFSGYFLQGKLSSKDDKLFPLIKEILCHINPELEGKIDFSDQPLKQIDAIIATGSNNSSRYFEYYFGKYPHIIRKNRNSVALITGDESKSELKKLADDVFIYFGLGCRSVSKLYIPQEYDPAIILSCFEVYSYLYNHNKYANNYDYHKAILLINMEKHLDTGFLLLKEASRYSSPIGVLNFERYNSLEGLKNKLRQDEELIQCIIASEGLLDFSIPFGCSQHPELWDYADNVDTLKFLLNLYKK